MCLSNNKPNKKYEQLNYEKRILIEYLYNIKHLNFSKIAKQIGTHRTTISREIRNNLVKQLRTDYTEYYVYSAQAAQEKHDFEKTAKGPKLLLDDYPELEEKIIKLIKGQKYSPEMAAIKLKQEYNKKIIDFKTIYNYIEKQVINLEYEDLPCGKYKTRKKSNRKESPIRKYKKENHKIEDRPQEINDRKRCNDWEGDTVVGKRKGKGKCLLVLTNRKTRREYIFLIEGKNNYAVVKALDKLEKSMGKENFKRIFETITFDNGSEFWNYEAIQKSIFGGEERTYVYYAEAYCSWQRGSNENANKLIRRFIPKGTSMDDLTNEMVEKIENWMNSYPRKILGYLSPIEYENEKVA